MTAPHITLEQLLQHQDWLHGFVRSMVRDDFSADDMVQATFAEALEDPNAGNVNLKAWLAGTARNLIRNQWRSNSRRRVREEKVAIPIETIRNQSLELSDYLNETNKAIGQLPELERVAIMLRYINEMKPREIAVELEIQVHEVYRLLETSKSKLRQRMAQRFGKDWQALGLGILGLPIGTAPSHTGQSAPSHTTSISPLWLIAGASFVVAGAFFLNPWGGPGDPEPQEETPGMLASAINPGNGDPHHAGPQRGPGTQASTQAEGFQVRAINTAGDSLEDAVLVLNYADGTWDDLQAVTDQEGVAVFDIPSDAEGITLYGRTEGHWNEAIFLPQYSEGVHDLVFFEGMHEAFVKVTGAPLGTEVRLKGSPSVRDGRTWFGLATTDAQGRIHLRLPDYGHYRIRIPESSHHRSSSSFAFTPTGLVGADEIPFTSGGSLQLQAVGQAGTPLPEAHYFQKVHQPDPDGFHDYRYLPLESARGVLEYTEVPREMHTILVSHEGYRSELVEPSDLPMTDSMVILELEETAPSMLTGLLAGRRWASLEIREEIPSTTWDEKDGTRRNHVNGKFARKVEVGADGSFRLPRCKDGEDGSFLMKGIDDQGLAYYSSACGPEARRAEELSFVMVPDLRGTTTVRFHPRPTFASSRLLLGAAFPEGLSGGQTLLDQDAQGRHVLETRAGDVISLTYESLDMEYSVSTRLPDDRNAIELEFPWFETSAVLQGVALTPDGSPLREGTRVRATYLDALPEDGYQAHAPPTLTILLTQVEGVLQGPACPPGLYRLDLPWTQRLDAPEVRTGEDFHLPAPNRRSLIAQARDQDRGTALSVDLYGPNSQRLGQAAQPLKQGEFTTPLLVAEVPEDIPFASLVLAADGYEPHVPSQAVPGLAYEPFLQVGRGGPYNLDLPDAGVQWDPENSWICRSWGGPKDPRQVMIATLATKVYCRNLPTGVVFLEEVDPSGQRTGQVVRLAEDGTLTPVTED